MPHDQPSTRTPEAISEQLSAKKPWKITFDLFNRFWHSYYPRVIGQVWEEYYAKYYGTPHDHPFYTVGHFNEWGAAAQLVDQLSRIPAKQGEKDEIKEIIELIRGKRGFKRMGIRLLPRINYTFTFNSCGIDLPRPPRPTDNISSVVSQFRNPKTAAALEVFRKYQYRQVGESAIIVPWLENGLPLVPLTYEGTANGHTDQSHSLINGSELVNVQELQAAAKYVIETYTDQRESVLRSIGGIIEDKFGIDKDTIESAIKKLLKKNIKDHDILEAIKPLHKEFHKQAFTANLESYQELDGIFEEIISQLPESGSRTNADLFCFRDWYLGGRLCAAIQLTLPRIIAHIWFDQEFAESAGNDCNNKPIKIEQHLKKRFLNPKYSGDANDLNTTAGVIGERIEIQFDARIPFLVASLDSDDGRPPGEDKVPYVGGDGIYVILPAKPNLDQLVTAWKSGQAGNPIFTTTSHC